MKYHIKRETADNTEYWRYFAEDERGMFMDGTMHLCPKDSPQENQDFAVDIVIFKIKQKINPAVLIKTIEL